MIHVFDPHTGSLHRTSDDAVIDLGVSQLPFSLADADPEIVREAVQQVAITRGHIPQGHTVAIFS